MSRTKKPLLVVVTDELLEVLMAVITVALVCFENPNGLTPGYLVTPGSDGSYTPSLRRYDLPTVDGSLLSSGLAYLIRNPFIYTPWDILEYIIIRNPDPSSFTLYVKGILFTQFHWSTLNTALLVVIGSVSISAFRVTNVNPS